MGYFSKELQILDRNTVKYMIDQLQEDNDKLQEAKAKLQAENTTLLQQQNYYMEQHTRDAERLEKYKALYGELPNE